MTLDSDALCAEILRTLRASVNADGGWSYFPGKASRLEPTCWAFLALLDAGESPEDDVLADATLTRLAAWQRADGLVSEFPSAPANLAFNGLTAVAVLRAMAKHRASPDAGGRLLRALLSAIVTTKGVRLKQPESSRQNSQLTGWPWIDGTYSWVEPTSWCLLALKKAGRLPWVEGAADRIAEANRLLEDRCGVSGGWTVGTTNVLGNELFPYVPTTAVALLALGDRPALPEVVRSVSWLSEHWPRERSSLALSMALIAMAAHGRATDGLDLAIRAHVTGAGLPGNVSWVALLLYALTGARHGYAALKV